MNYKEYKDAQQAEFNKLPIFWAFSDKQFEEALNKRGVKLEEAKEKVSRFYGGGFYLKKDRQQILDWMKVDHDKELREKMEADHEFAKDALTYEAFNHEYPINWQGDWDVASCFGQVTYSDDKGMGDYLRELGFSDSIIVIWREVRKEVFNGRDW